MPVVRSSPGATRRVRQWHRIALALGATLVAMLMSARTASAQSCPLSLAGSRPALATHDAAERIEYIRRRLNNGASRSLLWAFGWGSTYATIATAQIIRIPLTQDPTSRIEAGIAAGAAGIGAAFIAIAPPAIIGDAPRLQRQVTRIGPHTDMCALVAEAERLLLRDAVGQVFGVGWLLQGGALMFNFAIGLVLGLVLHDYIGGLISMAVGITSSQIMFLTKPTDAVDAIRRYRAGDLRWTTARSTSYFIAAPDFAANRVGIRLQLVF